MTFPFDDTIPAATHNPSADQPIMLANNQQNELIWGVDHITFNSITAGQHQRVLFPQDFPQSSPASPASVLFTDTASSVKQLKFYSGDAAHSSNQYTLAANGSTLVLGGIIIKWFQVVFPNGSGGGVVSFSTFSLSNFPTNAFTAFLTNGSTGFSTAVSALTSSTITIAKSPSTGQCSVNVLVIGD